MWLKQQMQEIALTEDPTQQGRTGEQVDRTLDFIQLEGKRIAKGSEKMRGNSERGGGHIESQVLSLAGDSEGNEKEKRKRKRKWAKKRSVKK